VAWTVENPSEMKLEGKHGKGWCYQTEAQSDDDLGHAVKNLMRATPNIIFIGELRDASAVKEALAAATSGHLVVATFHASDLQSGIARLARFAGQEQGAASVADALKLGMHLSLHNHVPGQPGTSQFASASFQKATGTPPRILTTSSLWVTGQSADGVRSILRHAKYQELSTEINRQRQALMGGKAF
jgi:twitching motility protein PilT